MFNYKKKIKELNHKLLEELMTTLCQLIEAQGLAITGLQTAVTTLQNAPANDPTAAIAAAITPIQTQLNTLSDFIGTLSSSDTIPA